MAGGTNLHDRRYAPGPVGGVTLLDLVVVAKRYPLTIALTTLVVLALATAWVGTRQPVYRASATVVLETEPTTGSALGELAALGGAPLAASEIAVLRSRSIALETVRDPRDGRLASPEHPEYERHLGLATRVDDRGLLPLATLLSRLTGKQRPTCRMFAAVERLDPDAPERFRMEWLDQAHVRLWVPAGFGFVREADEVCALSADGMIEWNGLRIELHCSGEPTGRRFEVTTVTESAATKRLQESTSVVETERNTGVLQVSVSDSDPRRAADTVNALCNNYLLQNVSRGQRRASRTLEFIESQLAVQDLAVEAASNELVELQAEFPEAIDLSASAQALVARLSELELEQARLGVRASTLDEALTLLAEGDFHALSRIQIDTADPISAAYVAEISLLSSQSELQDRSDASSYRILLQENLLRLEGAFDQAGLEIDNLDRVVTALHDGALNALASVDSVDPITGGLLREIATLEAEEARLAQEFTDEYPPLATLRQARLGLVARVEDQLASRLAGLRERQLAREELVTSLRDVIEAHPADERARIAEALAKLEQRTLEHLRSRRAGLATQQAALDQEIALAEEQLGGLPEAERRQADPKRRLETHLEIQRFLRTSLEQARITHASTLASADLIDPAIPPSERSTPRVGFTLMLCTLLGAGLGLGLALLRERTRGSLHTQAELEEATDLPTFGVIPDFRQGLLRVKGAGAFFLGMRDDPEGPIAEAYRGLRANLRFVVAPGEGRREPRSLALTSCAPGEGKSTTNVDLALAFAGAGRRVLLVDADLRRPSVHRFLGRPRSPGLTDILGQGLDWRTCVQESIGENLDLISAGATHSAPGELLLRPELESLTEEWCEHYDLVLFDLPPALVVADVAGFAHKLDAILLLYRAGGLPRTAVVQGVESLRRAGANVVGVVLNAARATRGESKQYGYGAGYYGEKSQEAR
jgi:capsular exopolysaccharide synthesis family protein